MDKQECSIEQGSDAWPPTTNPLNNTSSDGDASQQQEHNSSGKQRKSRWDLCPVADGTCKRRKSRWASDDSQLLGPSQLPDFVRNPVGRVDLDPEIHGLNIRLVEITEKLRGSKVLDDRPEEERSPSPPPEYNNLGIRINPREARLRKKLIEEKQGIISRLILKTLKPPSDQKPKFCKKLYVPVKDYPDYKFVGLIIGPRGNTQKRMEKESGAKIHLRGKGSRKEPKTWPPDGEDLHVLIEADSQKSLDAAVGMVEKLLVPVKDEVNTVKQAQLKELAELNPCKRCGEHGHTQFSCPDRKFNVDVLCDVCGGDHATTNCPLTASDSGNIMDSQFHSAISDIGNGIAVFGASPIPSRSIHGRDNPASSADFCFYGSSPNTGCVTSTAAPEAESKTNKEIDDSSLYVGGIPFDLDDKQLMQLFSPFGNVIHAHVIKDRTTGMRKGYGFVKYSDPANAAKAIEGMNELKIGSRMLAVKVAGRPEAARISDSGGTTALKLLPPYPGPPSVPQDNHVQSAWPGPPQSMLQEPCATFFRSDALGLPPVSSEETDRFSRRLPSYYRSGYMISEETVQSAWPGPPGSVLREPCATFSRRDSLDLPPVSSEETDRFARQLPSYYGSDNDYLISGEPVQSAWPGPPGSMLREPCATFSRSDALDLPPINSEETNRFGRQLPSYYGSDYLISSPRTLSSFPGNPASSTDYSTQSDSVNKQIPLSSGSSCKIPCLTTSTLSELPTNLSSSPSNLGQDYLFPRRSPSSYRSSYDIPASSSSALASFPGNLRSSPGELVQTDSFSRQFPL
eukprot:TRINITY_DN9628_c0_g1_i1.p1 TRINITY_DN9628_c0_g1~~TRINITY_DN9628_c0_g1_i1.p1  ORF type:complete len:796 (-),score=157.62 TRINITY_DN9628_c0_g1_i1:821-3208(-)